MNHLELDESSCDNLCLGLKLLIQPLMFRIILFWWWHIITEVVNNKLNNNKEPPHGVF